MQLGRISYAEFGLSSPAQQSKSTRNSLVAKFIYLCGVDLDSKVFGRGESNTFVIFQGSFINNLSYVDLVLPVPVYTENTSSYLNLEGRYRRTSQLSYPFLAYCQIFKFFKHCIFYVSNNLFQMGLYLKLFQSSVYFLQI